MPEFQVNCLVCEKPMVPRKDIKQVIYECDDIECESYHYLNEPEAIALAELQQRLAELEPLEAAAIEHGGAMHLANWAAGVGKENLGKLHFQHAMEKSGTARAALDAMCAEMNEESEQRKDVRNEKTY